MKTSYAIAIPLFALTLLFTGCGNKATNEVVDNNTEENTNDTAIVEEKDGSMIDVSKSFIRWEGSKKVGATHNGTINLKSGELDRSGSKINGGQFVIDMDTIVNEDLTGTGAITLENHLKSADFFNVEEYPEGMFEITEIEKVKDDNYNVTGDLTLKGITESISFPATITEEENDVLRMKGKSVLDRTLWDVRFGSGKFFANLGDALINDNMTVEFDIQTK